MAAPPMAAVTVRAARTLRFVPPDVHDDADDAYVRGLPGEELLLRAPVADPEPAATAAGDPGAVGARLAWVTMEVLAGVRPVPQLRALTNGAVYAVLADAARTGWLRAAGGGPAAIRSVRVYRPTASVAEVCVRLDHGSRARMMAARIEDIDGRWRCTAFQIVA
ncbi:MAG: Rv3235 family protein [Mycobacteriales bacterium]